MGTTGESSGPAVPPSPADDSRPVTEPPPAPESRPVSREHASEKRSLWTLVAQLTGVVSAIVALVGLVFVLVPGLKPEGPAASKGAAFADLTTDPVVTRLDYLRRLDRSMGDYTAAQLRRRGAVVSFNVVITGHKGESLPLRWGVYDAATGQQISREKATTLKAEAPTDQASWQVWTPLPKARGQFYVLLELFEEDGRNAITHARSPVFGGLRKD